MNDDIRSFLVLIAVLFTLADKTKGVDPLVIERGDVMVGVISVKTNFNETSPFILQNFLTIVTTLQDTPTVQGLKVGYVMFAPDDNCSQLISYIQRYPQIIALMIIGNSKQSSVKFSALVSALRIPTYTTTNGYLLDIILTYPNMEYMQRLTSTSFSQTSGTHIGTVGVIPSILTMLGVDIVSILYDNGTEPLGIYAELYKVLSDIKVDVELSMLVKAAIDTNENGGSNGYIRRIKDNTEAGRMTTIITVLTRTKTSLIFEKFRENNVSNVVLVSTSSNCIQDDFDDALKKNNIHFIRLCQTYYGQEKTEAMIANFNVSANGTAGSFTDILYKWYQHHANLNFASKWCNKSSVDSIGELILCGSGFEYSRYNHRFYIAVESTLNTLSKLNKTVLVSHGKRNTTEILYSTIGERLIEGFGKNGHSEFEFDEDGVKYNVYDVLYDGISTTISNGSLIFEWTESKNKTKFFNDSVKLIKEGILGKGQRINCSKTCKPGENINRPTDFINCWNCRKCIGNTYSNESNAKRCLLCNSDVTYLWANVQRTACNVAPISVNIFSLYGQLVLIFVGLSVCVWLCTIGFYVKYWKNKIIIASGRYLSISIFIALLLGYVESVLVATTPTSGICTAVQVIGHVFMALLPAPVFVKTLRIFLLFHFSVKWGNNLTKYMSTPYVLLQNAILTVPQIVLMIVGLRGEKTSFVIFHEDGDSEDKDGLIVVHKSCAPFSMTIMYISISYAALILIGSTGLGWWCRKLPDNYKESLHIFISSLISLVLVCAYVPAMVMMKGTLQVFFLSLVIAIIALTFNMLLFGPKIYACLFLSIAEQKSMFKKESLIAPNRLSTRASQI